VLRHTKSLDPGKLILSQPTETEHITLDHECSETESNYFLTERRV
jgi:hypothetical protein